MKVFGGVKILNFKYFSAIQMQDQGFIVYHTYITKNRKNQPKYTANGKYIICISTYFFTYFFAFTLFYIFFFFV